MSVVQLIDLPGNADVRGALSVAEYPGVLPFAPRRLFTLFGIADGADRGRHAHREQLQFLIAMAGSFTVDANDGSECETYILKSPRQALYVPPLVWLVLTDFTPNSVCAVLASAPYDEADYIRDQDEFTRLTGGR